MYLLRLDDAAEYMNTKNWSRMERVLDKYDIKPIVGIIPDIQDPELLKYDRFEMIWEKAKSWERKGWTIAFHGYNHVYITESGGINPVNRRSEFAGLDIQKQVQKIRKGYSIFLENNVIPKLFFAPSHTFDLNTLEALRKETPIRVISDTIANDIYSEYGFFFIPQQSGSVRTLPFSITTFCYHPNTMQEKDFETLEKFLKKKIDKFTHYDELVFRNRKRNVFDKLIKRVYFLKKRG